MYKVTTNAVGTMLLASAGIIQQLMEQTKLIFTREIT